MRGVILFALALALCGTAQAKPLAEITPAATLDVLDAAPVAADLIAFAPVAPVSHDTPPQILRGAQRLQCAVYARLRSGLDLRGLARSWWGQAQGRYARAQAPEVGAVLVLGGTPRGHVAVVAKVLSPTEILVDHANWMNHGEIELGALMRDVSGRGDWSAVRVWYPPSNGLGTKAYPVMGFILPGSNV